MPRIAVIIPARDEEKNIGSVIEDVRIHLPEASIIVVDDQSRDRTSEVAARYSNTFTLKSPVKLGIGGAVQLGIQYAYAKNFEVFLRMDADGQHDAAYLPKMLNALKLKTLVVGSRSQKNFSASSNLIRKLGSRYFSGLFFFFLHEELPDPTSGYICFGRDIAALFSNFLPSDFPEIEMEVLLLKAGYKIYSIPTEMRIRQNGKSSIDIIHSLVYVFSVTMAFFISFSRPNPYKVRAS